MTGLTKNFKVELLAQSETDSQVEIKRMEIKRMKLKLLTPRQFHTLDIKQV